jgi:predicted transcriptional regulator
MEEQSLKSEIYRKLDELDDEGLNMVNEMVTAYLKKTDDDVEWNALSDEDRAAIEEGLEQADKGMTVPHEVVMERLNKKFGFK